MIGRLGYTCVETRDIARSRAFYTEKLGLKLTAEGEGWFTLDGGGQSIVVWQGENPAFIMGLVQPELEAARATLKERGIEAEEIQSHPGGRHFNIQDPDGNLIMISDD